MITWFFTSRASQGFLFCLCLLILDGWVVILENTDTVINGPSQRNIWKAPQLGQLFFATADTQADCRPTSLLTCCSCCPSQRVLHNYSAELTVYAVMVHLAGSPVAWQKRTIWALSSKQSTFFLTHKPFFHTRNLFSLIYWLNVLYNTHLMTLCPSWRKFVALWKNLRIHFLSPTWNPRDPQECC